MLLWGKLHDGQAVTSVALALNAPAAAGRHDKLAFGAAHGRVALDVARAGADEGEENAGACARARERDGVRAAACTRTAAAHEVRVLQHADVGCSARHRPPYDVISFVERLRQLQ